MIKGIPKKIIFTSFLFINFIQPSKTADFQKVNNKDVGSTKLISSRTLDNIKLFNNLNLTFDNSDDIFAEKNLLNKYSEPLLVRNSVYQEGVIIQSD